MVSDPAPKQGDQAAVEAGLARRQRIERTTELVSVILLSITALVVALSAYAASAWGTTMSLKLGQANTRRLLGSRAAAQAGQLTTIDINLFANWLNAYATGEIELAQFYQQRFRPEFVPAFEAWVATEPRTNPDAPRSPFALPEYQVSEAQEAARLDEEAAALTAEAMVANDKRDGYALATVLLASVLFFVGMSQRLRQFPLRVAAVGVGAFLFVVAVSWLLTLTPT